MKGENFGWWTHNTIHRWCILELYTSNLYNFINQCHPHKCNTFFFKVSIIDPLELILWHVSKLFFPDVCLLFAVLLIVSPIQFKICCLPFYSVGRHVPALEYCTNRLYTISISCSPISYLIVFLKVSGVFIYFYMWTLEAIYILKICWYFIEIGISCLEIRLGMPTTQEWLKWYCLFVFLCSSLEVP